MPAKKPKVPRGHTKKATRPISGSKLIFRSDNKRLLKIVLVTFLVLGGTFLILKGLAWQRGNDEAIKAQQTIEKYLEDKYDQGFVVEKPVPEGYGFAIEGVMKAEAYPSADPSSKFEAWTSSYGSNDEYPGAYWQKQAYDYLKPPITKVFGYDPELKVEIFTANIDGKKIQSHLPSFSDALTSYNDRMNIKLTITSRESIRTSSDKSLVAQRVYSLIDQLEKTNVDVFSVNYNGSTGGGLSYRDSKGKTTIEVKRAEDLVSIIREGE